MGRRGLQRVHDGLDGFLTWHWAKSSRMGGNYTPIGNPVKAALMTDGPCAGAVRLWDRSSGIESATPPILPQPGISARGPACQEWKHLLSIPPSLARPEV